MSGHPYETNGSAVADATDVTLPPHDIDAERAALGSAMHQGDHGRCYFDEVAARVGDEDFYDERHRITYASMRSLREAGTPIDVVTLADALSAAGHLEEVGGAAFVMDLFQAAYHGENAGYYADIVAEKAQRRALRARGLKLFKAACDPLITVDEALELMDVSEICRPRSERFPSLTSAELDAIEDNIRYLIAGVLAEGQPYGLCGSKKSLKTNTLVDMAISLAVGPGAKYLGEFVVPRAVRVALISGESGRATIRETARRVARSKGLHLDAIAGVRWCFHLPKLGSPSDLIHLRHYIRRHRIEVLIIDPLYLCLDVGADAGNLFAMGKLLSGLGPLMEDTGCTLVLCHHTRKAKPDPYSPPELEDIAWAGFQEFFRQWGLLGRREAYDAERAGSHRLWLNVGGSAGHSGLWAIDVEEGSPDDDEGRRWDVSVMKASQARAVAAQEQSDERAARDEQRRLEKREVDRKRVLEALEALPSGDTKSGIKDLSGVDTSRLGPILVELVRERVIEPCQVMKTGRAYDGFKLTRMDPDRTRISGLSEFWEGDVG